MMKRALFFTLFIAILLLGALPAAVAQEDFSGRSITFVTVQPHAVASRYVAQLFEAETGATVEVVDVPYDTIASQALLDVVSGVGQYDVIEIWYPSLGLLASEGVLVDLTDWYEEKADIIEPDDFAPTIADPYTLWDGRRWAVPYDGDTHILFYNRVLFERFGLEPPTTWAEYEEVCRTITEAGAAEGIYGCAIMGAQIPLILIGTFANRLGGFGGGFLDEDGNPIINSPEAVAALEALLSQAQYALPTPSATAFDEAVGAFVTGRAAMMEFWTDLGQIADNPEGSEIIGQWGAVPMLVAEPGMESAPALNAGFSVGVSTLSRDPELALAFIEFIARPDVNVMVNTIVGGLDPTRISTFDNEAYRAHVTPELADTAKAALTAATAWPTDPLWPEMAEVLTQNLGAALSGDKTAQQALDDTQAAWESILGR
ncbi:MAG: sugar ABC transporter substrate-binding protein [Aggregatilineales bacterium]